MAKPRRHGNAKNAKRAYEYARQVREEGKRRFRVGFSVDPKVDPQEAKFPFTISPVDPVESVEGGGTQGGVGDTKLRTALNTNPLILLLFFSVF